MNEHRLRRSRALVLFVSAAATTAVLASAPVAHAGERSPGSGRPATQAALESVVDNGTPGVIARVDRGKRSWNGTAGVADRERPGPRRPGEHFRIGSITKTFTAVTMLKLEAEGKLSLDDSVEEWLPGALDHDGYDGRSITLRRLLNHTSGVYDILRDRGFASRYTGSAFLEHRYDSWTPDELVEIATSHPPEFAAGTQWSYSNTNYLLAGMVIEAATGKSYGEAVDRRLLGPHLRKTVVPGFSSAVPEPHAQAYSRLFVDAPDAEVYDTTEFDPSMAGAAGEIISTTRDLNRFFGALLAGRILPADQQEELLAGVDTGNGYRYGLGVRTYPLPCGTMWGHDGDILGSVTYAVSSRDGSHVVSLNENANWNDDEHAENVITTEFCG
ncbi:serine hydrolase domain-containing protein [Streptomonospora salina]|uniref:D-alanyl-D-alanine carboxypeptidase n=1 Tax=Streptomonospora salina TaxID=104205 RepID=A0A841E9I6_9ACTN|nr:serine hydrolase domain-containing protein [Streptomonospora salina]MBB5997743.1 D-alanyl-D-alanine carboxypeptidase [Streptomonospora salina]